MTTSIAVTSSMAESVPVKTDFKVWKTLKFAKITHKIVSRLEMSSRVTRSADRMLLHTYETGKKGIVKLVKVTAEELGFQSGATFEQIYLHVWKLGLELCPRGIGPYLRMEYRNQPRGEWLLIAMKPIRIPWYCPSSMIFSIGNSSYYVKDLLMIASCEVDYGPAGGDARVFEGSQQWVFACPD